MPRQARQRARRGRSATTLVPWSRTVRARACPQGCSGPVHDGQVSIPTGEVGLGLTGVGDADHRVGVRARRTSVVYQARDGQGSAGVGHTLRRCAGPTASLRWARLGTLTIFGEELAYAMLGRAC